MKKSKFYINWKQAEKIKKIAYNMMLKNHIYKEEDLKQAWEKFLIDVETIASGKNIKLLTSGNLKISNKIGIYDMPEIITCKYACKSCYACKSSRIYKNTRIYRMKHLLFILLAIYNNNFRKLFISNMVENCEKYEIIRLHGSGDFFSLQYLNIMLQVIKLCKHVKFYTYTKILENKKIDYINKNYENFNIIKSVININNQNFINFGEHDYINKLAEKLEENKKQYFICNYQNMEKHTCMETCHACLNCPHVLFYKH